MSSTTWTALPRRPATRTCTSVPPPNRSPSPGVRKKRAGRLASGSVPAGRTLPDAIGLPNRLIVTDHDLVHGPRCRSRSPTIGDFSVLTTQRPGSRTPRSRRSEIVEPRCSGIRVWDTAALFCASERTRFACRFAVGRGPASVRVRWCISGGRWWCSEIETGLKDKVNHHYLQIFGASIAVGAIGGLAEVGTNTTSLGLAETPADAYRQGVATSLSQSSMHILDRFLNLLPTITIREGHRVKVYLMQDLLVPDYAQHEMPSDI